MKGEIQHYTNEQYTPCSYFILWYDNSTSPCNLASIYCPIIGHENVIIVAYNMIKPIKERVCPFILRCLFQVNIRYSQGYCILNCFKLIAGSSHIFIIQDANESIYERPGERRPATDRLNKTEIKIHKILKNAIMLSFNIHVLYILKR